MTDAWKGILGSVAIGVGAGFKAKAGVDLEKKQQYKECIMSGELSASACSVVTGYNPQEGEDMSGVVSEIQNREQNEARLKEIGQLPFPLQGAASETTVQGKPLSLNMRTSMGQLGQGKVNIDEFTPSPQSAEIPGVAPPDWRQKAGVEANRLTGIAETKEQATWESRLSPKEKLERKVADSGLESLNPQEKQLWGVYNKPSEGRQPSETEKDDRLMSDPPSVVKKKNPGAYVRLRQKYGVDDTGDTWITKQTRDITEPKPMISTKEVMNKISEEDIMGTPLPKDPATKYSLAKPFEQYAPAQVDSAYQAHGMPPVAEREKLVTNINSGKLGKTSEEAKTFLTGQLGYDDSVADWIISLTNLGK